MEIVIPELEGLSGELLAIEGDIHVVLEASATLMVQSIALVVIKGWDRAGNGSIFKVGVGPSPTREWILVS